MESPRTAARIREDLEWFTSKIENAAKAEDQLPTEPEPTLDRNRFVVVAYKSLLGREPSPQEILRHARLLRFLPFVYTERRFLARLRDCWEGIQHQKRSEADLLLRLKLLETRQEQIRNQLKSLHLAVTELGIEVIADLRDNPGGVSVPQRELRHLPEGSPCAS